MSGDGLGDDDVISVPERREALGVIVVDGIRPLLDSGLELTEVLDYALRVIACELVAMSVTLTQETQPALRGVGALVGGLFGVERADGHDDDGAEDDPDGVMDGLWDAGRRMRKLVLHDS